MDYIQDIFERNTHTLIKKLEVAGFSNNQSSDFLSEIAPRIFESTQYAGIAKSISDLLADPAQFLSSVNVESIAQKLDMSCEQVTSGLALVVPVMTQALESKNDGLADMVHTLHCAPMVNLFGSAKKLIGLRG
jgi:uncharacterized membrane-anchored protein